MLKWTEEKFWIPQINIKCRKELNFKHGSKRIRPYQSILILLNRSNPIFFDLIGEKNVLYWWYQIGPDPTLLDVAPEKRRRWSQRNF